MSEITTPELSPEVRKEAETRGQDYGQWLWDNGVVVEIRLQDRALDDGTVKHTQVWFDKNTGNVVLGQLNPSVDSEGNKLPLPKGLFPAYVTIPALSLQALMPDLLRCVNQELTYLGHLSVLDKPAKE